MRPLPREHKRRTPPQDRTPDHPRIRLTRRQRGQPAPQILHTRTHHHRTVLEHRPRQRQRQPHISRRTSTVHHLQQPRRLRPQSPLTPPRHRPHHNTGTGTGTGTDARLLRVPLTGLADNVTAVAAAPEVIRWRG
ncbi:hypothetical protein [Streptomyces capitiformicae]|uniref:hypothetical protein n=1 Tax=Streptomyces capitiformicae TaxID=2014920 RepID=UPI001AD832EA